MGEGKTRIPWRDAHAPDSLLVSISISTATTAQERLNRDSSIGC